MNLYKKYLNKDKYYLCYSANLKNFFGRYRFIPIDNLINHTNGKQYWVFPKGIALDVLMKKYQDSKKNHLADKNKH